MAIRIGDRAPDFSLPPAPGPARVSLSELNEGSPVLVLFFPLAFSGVCTDEMCAVVDDWSSWSELDVEIVGISVDSPFVTRKFREDTGVPFPLLSDFNQETVAAYDVQYADFFGLRGVAKRAAFVIDREGIVRWVWVTEDADVIPDFTEVKKAVRSLQA